MEEEKDRDVKEYLAKIRRTIAESENAVSQAELRIAETDRLLAAQGLTREQALNLKLSAEQRRLVNEELKRRGLPELEEDEMTGTPPPPYADTPSWGTADTQGDLDNRKRRFDAMMQQFRM